MDGQLEQRDGRWQLRFVRRFSEAPQKVWEAITAPEHLQAWFPDRIVVSEWKPGAALQFLTDFGNFDGEVITVERPRLLEFRWGTDVLRFEIGSDSQGTTLTLIDRIDQLGKAARDAAGWDVHLQKLVDHLSGGKATVPSERWREVHPRYVERFGPDASTIGPPETLKA